MSNLNLAAFSESLKKYHEYPEIDSMEEVDAVMQKDSTISIIEERFYEIAPDAENNWIKDERIKCRMKNRPLPPIPTDRQVNSVLNKSLESKLTLQSHSSKHEVRRSISGILSDKSNQIKVVCSSPTQISCDDYGDNSYNRTSPALGSITDTAEESKPRQVGVVSSTPSSYSNRSHIVSTIKDDISSNINKQSKITTMPNQRDRANVASTIQDNLSSNNANEQSNITNLPDHFKMETSRLADRSSSITTKKYKISQELLLKPPRPLKFYDYGLNKPESSATLGIMTESQKNSPQTEDSAKKLRDRRKRPSISPSSPKTLPTPTNARAPLSEQSCIPNNTLLEMDTLHSPARQQIEIKRNKTKNKPSIPTCSSMLHPIQSNRGVASSNQALTNSILRKRNIVSSLDQRWLGNVVEKPSGARNRPPVLSCLPLSHPSYGNVDLALSDQQHLEDAVKKSTKTANRPLVPPRSPKLCAYRHNVDNVPLGQSSVEDVSQEINIWPLTKPCHPSIHVSRSRAAAISNKSRSSRNTSIMKECKHPMETSILPAHPHNLHIIPAEEDWHGGMGNSSETAQSLQSTVSVNHSSSESNPIEAIASGQKWNIDDINSYSLKEQNTQNTALSLAREISQSIPSSNIYPDVIGKKGSDSLLLTIADHDRKGDACTEAEDTGTQARDRAISNKSMESRLSMQARYVNVNTVKPSTSQQCTKKLSDKFKKGKPPIPTPRRPVLQDKKDTSTANDGKEVSKERKARKRPPVLLPRPPVRQDKKSSTISEYQHMEYMLIKSEEVNPARMDLLQSSPNINDSDQNKIAACILSCSQNLSLEKPLTRKSVEPSPYLSNRACPVIVFPSDTIAQEQMEDKLIKLKEAGSLASASCLSTDHTKENDDKELQSSYRLSHLDKFKVAKSSGCISSNNHYIHNDQKMTNKLDVTKTRRRSTEKQAKLVSPTDNSQRVKDHEKIKNKSDMLLAHRQFARLGSNLQHAYSFLIRRERKNISDASTDSNRQQSDQRFQVLEGTFKYLSYKCTITASLPFDTVKRIHKAAIWQSKNNEKFIILGTETGILISNADNKSQCYYEITKGRTSWIDIHTDILVAITGADPYDNQRCFLCAQLSDSILIMKYVLKESKFVQVKIFKYQPVVSSNIMEIFYTRTEDYPFLCVGVNQIPNSSSVDFITIDLNRQFSAWPDNENYVNFNRMLDCSCLYQFNNSTVLVCVEDQCFLFCMNGIPIRKHGYNQAIKFSASISFAVIERSILIGFHENFFEFRSIAKRNEDFQHCVKLFEKVYYIGTTKRINLHLILQSEIYCLLAELPTSEDDALYAASFEFQIKAANLYSKFANKGLVYVS
ncbi:uncharacterized protein TRIADDRAFT_56465 [Trichoplax adhaerens]|uniref:CNH domain-containing protein n=1 Tax=Trichoplax adhaerens TaxID=10228 RepID=B3RY78_TRIAD|nr:hypothetical protein TRIADDRAFT_56465 [Trichoplax adhaerens]EDV24987.1 hypothetical protein TRIADDRAFT_56465 [Trichoplax adhaerens]|eukprot:XP_002112877.1 hypothetical protein TRIADDRAFT_56465 [Trichoplax adhaerens]